MRYLLSMAALGALTLAACDDGTDPVAGSQTLGHLTTSIASVRVTAGNTTMGDAALQGEQGPTMFQVQLEDRDAMTLSNVESCQIHYDLPARMPGMRRRGVADCYDNGSHGDDVPHDGVYHYRDDDDSVGCGRSWMPTGEYLYDFVCHFTNGSTSERSVAVTRQ